MANVKKVVYEDLPNQAQEVRKTAQEMNNEFQSIYKSVDNLRENWYGQRYNDLLTSLNNASADFNSIIDLMQRELPYTLETIANNYSRVDRGQNIVRPDNTKPQKIASIPYSDEFGIKFQTTEIEQTKSKCISSFAFIEGALNNMQGMIDNMSWESSSSDKFKSEYQELKTKITDTINGIKSQFDKSVVQTIADYKITDIPNINI